MNGYDWPWHVQLGWTLALIAGVVLVARGIHLGRPVTGTHAVAALTMVVAGVGAHLMAFRFADVGFVVAAGAALMWPTRCRPHSDDLARIWTLVEATHGDPLAPFAMHSTKRYYFNPEGTAAIAFRTRLGFAVVSGDPVGQHAQFGDLVAGFAQMCHDRGWRILVLCCSAQRRSLWCNAARIGQSLTAVPVGRDVVVDAAHFSMVGRKYRNLRQAVQRTHNRGLTTELVDEQKIDETLAAELTEVLYNAHRGARVERGFSMTLDKPIEGSYPGVSLMIARDRSGRVQGFHRYVTAGGGSDVSLDVPWRRPDAPNGIDERLTVDMITTCQAYGGQRLSLAFAAFPELFDNPSRSCVDRIYYALIKIGGPLIKLESLYRYLRKFHALGQQRYVLLSIRHLPMALVVLLSLEFMPRLRRRPPPRLLRA